MARAIGASEIGEQFITDDDLSRLASRPITMDELAVMPKTNAAPDVLPGYYNLAQDAPKGRRGVNFIVDLPSAASLDGIPDNNPVLPKPEAQYAGRMADISFGVGMRTGGGDAEEKKFSVVDMDRASGRFALQGLTAYARANRDVVRFAKFGRSRSVRRYTPYHHMDSAIALFEENDGLNSPIVGLSSDHKDRLKGTGDWVLKDVLTGADANPFNGYANRSYVRTDNQGSRVVEVNGLVSEYAKAGELRMLETYGPHFDTIIDGFIAGLAGQTAAASEGRKYDYRDHRYDRRGHRSFTNQHGHKISVTDEVHRLIGNYLHGTVDNPLKWSVGERALGQLDDIKTEVREHGLAASGAANRQRHIRSEIAQAIMMTEFINQVRAVSMADTVRNQLKSPINYIRWEASVYDAQMRGFATRLPEIVKNIPLGMLSREEKNLALKVAGARQRDISKTGTGLVSMLLPQPGTELIQRDLTDVEGRKIPMAAYIRGKGLGHSALNGSTRFETIESVYDPAVDELKMPGIIGVYDVDGTDIAGKPKRIMLVDLNEAPGAVTRGVMEQRYPLPQIEKLPRLKRIIRRLPILSSVVTRATMREVEQRSQDVTLSDLLLAERKTRGMLIDYVQPKRDAVQTMPQGRVVRVFEDGQGVEVIRTTKDKKWEVIDTTVRKGRVEQDVAADPSAYETMGAVVLHRGSYHVHRGGGKNVRFMPPRSSSKVA